MSAGPTPDPVGLMADEPVYPGGHIGSVPVTAPPERLAWLRSSITVAAALLLVALYIGLPLTLSGSFLTGSVVIALITSTALMLGGGICVRAILVATRGGRAQRSRRSRRARAVTSSPSPSPQVEPLRVAPAVPSTAGSRLQRRSRWSRS